MFRAARRRSTFVAKSEEVVWIPQGLHAPIHLRRRQERGCLLMKNGEDWMFSHAPEPIGRIPGIGFNPVCDGMPVASFPRRNILSDLVAELPVAGHQDETAQGGLGIVRVREELFGIGGQEVRRKILRMEFAGGQRDRLA